MISKSQKKWKNDEIKDRRKTALFLEKSFIKNKARVDPSDNV